jgi:hypothetical protein
MVIPFAMGTFQGDFLGGALFVLVHFTTLHSITKYFPSCLFALLTNDIHIIGPPSFVSFAYEHFQRTLCNKSFYPTLQMCSMVPLWPIT